jgi:hypothetical protein
MSQKPSRAEGVPSLASSEPAGTDAAPKEKASARSAVPGLLGIGAFVLASLALGGVQGPRAALLLLAAGALALTVWLFWSSLRALLGETPLGAADAYALAVPRAEEEQKRAVLRAIKDLEFERSVGKINEEDFLALTSKYRAEAKRLLQLLDEQTAESRARAQSRIEERLAQEGLLARDLGEVGEVQEARAGATLDAEVKA